MEFGSEFVYVGDGDEMEEIPEEIFEENLGSIVRNALAATSGDGGGETCLLDILDTAGQEEYSAMREQYTQSGDCFLVVYDVTSPQSFEEARHMFTFIQRIKHKSGVSMVLCGNKFDLDTSSHRVSEKDAKSLADQHNMPFFWTSAKTGFNVTEAFHEAVRRAPRTGIDYKVVVLGAGGVGKSSLTHRFVTGVFVDQYDPTVEDTFRKEIQISGLPKLESESSTKSTKRRSFLGGLFKKKRGPGLPPTPPPQNPRQPRGPPSGKTVRCQKKDGNVVLLCLGSLEDEAPLMTGEPVYCNGCQAILSVVSHVNKEGDSIQWVCEYCGHCSDNLDMDPAQVPTVTQVDYMLSPPPPQPPIAEVEQVEVKHTPSPGVLVYCIDISGSMGESIKIPALQAEWQALRGGGQYSNASQFTTRLDCMKKAVIRQLEWLELEEPDKQVAIVTFSSEVEFLGDGTTTSSRCEENMAKKGDCETLLQHGATWRGAHGIGPISNTIASLKTKIMDLRPTLMTALGPALTLSVGFVSDTPCSEVIVCTDGMANVGVGSIGGTNDTSTDFYRQIGNLAKDKQIKVSVLGITGAGCGLDILAVAADITSGTANVLHPDELIRQIRLIGQEFVVATDVQVTLHLHHSLQWKDAHEQLCGSILAREIGNVTKESDHTFMFGVSKQEFKHDTLPFQAQITFRRKDGAKLLRAISYRRKITKDREEMQKNTNVAVIGTAAMHWSSLAAERGDYDHARRNLRLAQRLMTHNPAQNESHYSYGVENTDFDYQLQRLQIQLICSSGELDVRTKLIGSKKKAKFEMLLGGQSKASKVAKSRKCSQANTLKYYSYSYDD